MKEIIAELKAKLKESGISIKRDKNFLSVYQNTKKLFNIAYHDGFDTLVRDGLYTQVDNGFGRNMILTIYEPRHRYILESGDTGYQELLEFYRFIQEQSTVKQNPHKQYTATKQIIHDFCCQLHGMQTET